MKAWKWLRSFVDTLKTSLNVAAEEERRAQERWAKLLAEAERVFDRLVQMSSADSTEEGEDPQIPKEALIQAQGGHQAAEKLFQDLDQDQSGFVSRREWCGLLEQRYKTKERDEGPGKGR